VTRIFWRRATVFAILLVLAGAAPIASRRRWTPEEVGKLPVVVAGRGTSGLRTIETRLLEGDPVRAGLYTIAILVPPDTRIAAHTHRDDRTAVVVTGSWHFGYGAADAVAKRAFR